MRRFPLALTFSAATRAGAAAALELPDARTPETREVNGFVFAFAPGDDLCRFDVTPPAGEVLREVAVTLSMPLANFREVIVPDSGRGYLDAFKLIQFWGRGRQSRVNDCKVPLFTLVDQDGDAAVSFGVFGERGPVETDFLCVEPFSDRALTAWHRRLTLRIAAGSAETPLPERAARARTDGTVRRWLFLRDPQALRGRHWHDALSEFSGLWRETVDRPARTTAASLDPWWCSWTDWDSSRVDGNVVLDNVRAGLELGIRNFIIDDGWFGPGLDSPRGSPLNIGDWDPDPVRFPDLPGLSDRIRALGGRPILWCAPHAVAPDAKAFARLRDLLIEDEPGRLLMTANEFHSLCFRCPEARAEMASIAARLRSRYRVDGAKYDLFNCVPPVPCRNPNHRHDTDSALEGLALTFAAMDEATRALGPDYIVELKQNYATPELDFAGTLVRAGDTPYDPLGNHARTLFANATTPYAMNDYQSVTAHDDEAHAAAMVLRMLAAGVPSYSMDLASLPQSHKDLLRFWHAWYAERRDVAEVRRRPAGGLDCWRSDAASGPVYFTLDRLDRLRLSPEAEAAAGVTVAHGSFSPTLRLEWSDGRRRRLVVHTPRGASEPRDTAADGVMAEGLVPGVRLALEPI